MLLRIAFLLVSHFIIGVYLQSDCPQNSFIQFDQSNCTSRATESQSYFLGIGATCVPHCELYEYDYFGIMCTDTEPCPPAYNCEKRCKGTQEDMAKTCEVNDDCKTPSNLRPQCKAFCMPSEGGCMSYHANTVDFETTFWTAQKFKPECDKDGLWLAKQCKGGLHGRCMCYNSMGQRIFGEALRSEADDMTCACSRKRADLKAKGAISTLHCDTNGNFEKLQCQEGICWCAEPKTGVPTAPVVPEKAMAKLPCYSKTEVGSQYLRQCESKEYAISKTKEKLKLHGVKLFTTEIMRCDWDGAYGRYMIADSNAYCTWRNNSKIGTWQADAVAYLSILNCNCARDLIMYGHNLACTSYGNYADKQSLIDENDDFYYYCVDSDGFAKSDIVQVPKDEVLDCNVYY